MSTITLELPDELAARVATPEGLERVRALIEAEFGEGLPMLDPARLTPEDKAALDEAYDAVAQGKMHPFDPAKARMRAKELLAK